MIKSKLAKAFILGICLSVLSSGVAFASESTTQTTTVQSRQAVSQDDLIQKQKEIDQYIFEQHKDEIAQAGFTVTHTVALDSYVEIGITPYNDENANYLYEIFGNDMVKVVEGQQAVTLAATAGAPDTAVSSPAQGEPVINQEVLQKQKEIDQYVFEQHKEEIDQAGFDVTHTSPLDSYVEIGITPYNEENANYLYKIFGNDMVKVVEGQQAMIMTATASDSVAVELKATNRTLAQGSELTKTASSTPVYLAYTLGAIMLLGGAVFAARRLKTVKR